MKKTFFLSATFVAVSIGSIFFSCTKDKGLNPLIANGGPYTDASLLDSCKNNSGFMYYKSDPNAVYSGTNGPHGNFKLKFNKIAHAALTDGGKLPIGSSFPDGSLVVKEVGGNSLSLYAFLYKRENSWLWGEIKPSGEVIFSVKADANGACVSCHNQPGNRDLVNSFQYY